MFYRQCNDCNERWELGTSSTCTCAKDEPVAWLNKEQNTITWDKLYPDMDALYTTPPQRTWIGLTDDDWIKAVELCDFDKVKAFEFFEAKLKDLNT